MKTDNERDDIAEALAPYAPPETVDAPISLDADGMPLNFRDIALLVRKVIYKRRIAALITFALILSVIPVATVTTVLVSSWISADTFMRNIAGYVFLGIVVVMFITGFVIDILANMDIEELKRKSGYRARWFISDLPDPVSYAVQLLRQAGYRANRLFLPDMAQFDPPKEDTDED